MGETHAANGKALQIRILRSRCTSSQILGYNGGFPGFRQGDRFPAKWRPSQPGSPAPILAERVGIHQTPQPDGSGSSALPTPTTWRFACPDRARRFPGATPERPDAPPLQPPVRTGNAAGAVAEHDAQHDLAREYGARIQETRHQFHEDLA